MGENGTDSLLSQQEVDNMLHINTLLESRQDGANSLVGDLKRAILNSGKLDLGQWKRLREQLMEIESYIPHIDLIVRLKEEEAMDRLRNQQAPLSQ